LVLVLALGALGIGYAAWTDTITIDGTVNTGTVDVVVIDYSGTYVWKISDSPYIYVDSGWMTEIGTPPANAVDAFPNPPYDTPPGTADVDPVSIATAAEGAGGDDTIKVDFVNLFPCQYVTADFLLHYAGSIPVKVTVSEINLPELTGVTATLEYYKSDVTGAKLGEPLDIALMQLHYCDYILVVITIHVEQDETGANMGQTGSIDGTITVKQWNECDGEENNNPGSNPRTGPDGPIIPPAGSQEPTASPIIMCKWEQDTTASLEDGDPEHKTEGSQFLPPLVYEGEKMVQYWAVVTDPEGVETIEKVDVTVYHPAGPPEYGSVKYQLALHKVDREAVGMPAYADAKGVGLITYGGSYSGAEIMDELGEGTAEVYMVQEVLSYCQPAGEYLVHVDACDTNNVCGGSANTNLDNSFTYVAVPAFEVDFNYVNYGDVEVCQAKWISGDAIFNEPMAPAPVPNPATIRNIGNTDIMITVQQGDMGFGYSGDVGTEYQGSVPPDGLSNWNVVFDARIGSDSSNGMYYDPFVTVMLPNTLPLCHTYQFDFSIHIVESVEGQRTGTMNLGCVEVPFGGE